MTKNYISEYRKLTPAQIARAKEDLAAYEQGEIDALNKPPIINAQRIEQHDESGGSIRSDIISDHERWRLDLRRIEVTADMEPAELQQKIAALRAAEVERKTTAEIMYGINALYHLWPAAPAFDEELYARLNDTKPEQVIWAEGQKIARLQEISKNFASLLKILAEQPARLRKVYENAVQSSHQKTTYDPKTMDAEVQEFMSQQHENFAKIDAAVPHIEERAKFYDDVMNRKIQSRDEKLSEIPPAIKKLEEITKEAATLSQKATPLVAKARKLYQTTGWLEEFNESEEYKTLEKLAKILGKLQEKTYRFNEILAGIRSIDTLTRDLPTLPVTPDGIFLGLHSSHQTIVRKLMEAKR